VRVRASAFLDDSRGGRGATAMMSGTPCPPGRVRMSITVPPGMEPGRQLRVAYANRQYDVVIPGGVPPGGTFLMEVEAAGPQPPATQAPVPMGLPIHMEAERPRSAAPAPLNRTQTGRTIVAAAPRTQAEMKAECPICFEPLCAAKVGVFKGPDGKRVSQHFFNLEAAREWLASGSGQCPMTRKRITSVLEVPDMRDDPEGWFSAVDINGDGKLSRLEVIECLKAQLDVDSASLDAAAADPDHWMWAQWDTDGSGFIERHELLSPQGLASYVRQAFERRSAEGAIPDIASNKEAWYRYWDADNSGALDREEVVRALLKTFRMTSEQERVTMMRNTIDAIWPIFDDDGSGSIERNEFLRPNEGLADTIIATLGLDVR